MNNAKLITLLTETNLHIGVGQVSGIIDLPIARNETSGHPIIPSSGLKGAFRDAMRKKRECIHKDDDETINHLFGPEKVGGINDAAGAVLFGEGKLLLLPVRSLTQTFRWVTCPSVLRRLHRDMQMSLSVEAKPVPIPDLSDGKACIVNANPAEASITIEEFVIETNGWDNLTELAQLIATFIPPGANYIAEQIEQKLVVVPDEFFNYLALHALPTRQRNSLDKDTKLASDKALWSEEYVPPDSLFYSLLANRNTNNASDDLLKETPPFMQIGGKETIGCGWVQLNSIPSIKVENTNEE